MRTASVVDRFMPTLINLSNDDKINIIETLLVSMKGIHSPKSIHPSIDTLFSGDWENDIPASQLAEEYRASRHYDLDKQIEW